MRRAVDSGAQARWQCEYSSQLCRDRRLFWHRGIHALGEPKNAAIGQRPITERAGQGSGVKKRPLRIQPCHPEYSTAENLADDHTAHFRHTNFTLDHTSPRLCPVAIDRRGHRDLHAPDRPQNLAMKILICSDGTQSAEPAIHLGGLLAGPLQAQTTLLGIAETEQDERPLRDALQKQAQLLYVRGISPEIVVHSGEPVHQILDQTSKTNYDLVVIGARWTGAMGHYWRSEKTYEVIKTVEPPVLVAIGERKELKR